MRLRTMLTIVATGAVPDRTSAKYAMLGAIYRAVDAFGSRRKLNAMRRAAMSESYAWTRSASGYSSVYDRALAGPAP